MEQLGSAVYTASKTYTLRHNTWVTLFHPEGLPDEPVRLNQTGVYLCCSLAGDIQLHKRQNSQNLAARKMHLFRAVNEAPCQIDFLNRAALGLVAFISPEWCNTCPQGPNCRIGRFLLEGKTQSEIELLPKHQQIELDGNGSEICQRILRQRLPSDLNVLELETGILSLLSWTYTRGSPLVTNTTSNSPLPLRTTIKIRKAAEILRRCLDQPPTVVELSRQVGLNTSDLKRGFREIYDSSPARYSRQNRMETARNLLTNSALPILNIALEVGFSNPSQFTRAFRQHFGINPSEIRRRLDH